MAEDRAESLKRVSIEVVSRTDARKTITRDRQTGSNQIDWQIR